MKMHTLHARRASRSYSWLLFLFLFLIELEGRLDLTKIGGTLFSSDYSQYPVSSVHKSLNLRKAWESPSFPLDTEKVEFC
jgi:hypothetical protein